MKKPLMLGALVLAPVAAALFMVYGGEPAVAQTSTAAAAQPAGAVRRPLLITGTVDAQDSQAILVPPSNSSPVVLRNFVPEGTLVKAGDVVLRIDSQEAASVRTMKIEADQALARADKEIADLEVAAVTAERALVTAKAALAKAKVDAVLPKSQISGLDFDRYQAELERADRDLDVKKKASASAFDAVKRRRSDSELETQKLQVNIAFNVARQEQVQVRAARDGVVLHGYSEWRGGERYDEGSSAFPGNTVGQVMGASKMKVRAFALEADRPFISKGQGVRLGFDALPGATLQAKVIQIASAPEARVSWGNARYFRVDIELPDTHKLPLVAGMSVLIEPLDAPKEKVPATAAAAPADLKIDGEVASRTAFPVSPPSIPDIWQYSLAQLAPEGTPVKAGDTLATFEANEIRTQMEMRSSGLKEKLSALAKIKLDHAEGERSAELAVAEAQSNQERAQRKAMQPKELIRRIDYDKLVIERVLAEDMALLAVRERDAKIRARKAEVAALSSEVAQHQSAISLLTEGQARMTVKAPRDGMIVYRPQFNGEKFAVGSQVWMGLSVATLADQNQLIVNAKVPEVQSAAVRLGQAARVTVPGSNIALTAKVSSLGRTYHGKSRSAPVIVRDLELEFDSVPKGIKPGTAVQVTLLPPKGKA